MIDLLTHRSVVWTANGRRTAIGQYSETVHRVRELTLTHTNSQQLSAVQYYHIIRTTADPALCLVLLLQRYRVQPARHGKPQ